MASYEVLAIKPHPPTLRCHKAGGIIKPTSPLFVPTITGLVSRAIPPPILRVNVSHRGIRLSIFFLLQYLAIEVSGCRTRCTRNERFRTLSPLETPYTSIPLCQSEGSYIPKAYFRRTRCLYKWLACTRHCYACKFTCCSSPLSSTWMMSLLNAAMRSRGKYRSHIMSPGMPSKLAMGR